MAPAEANQGVGKLKVEDVAKELVAKQGKSWEELDDKDKTIYKNIARGVMMLSSDVKSIEE